MTSDSTKENCKWLPTDSQNNIFRLLFKKISLSLGLKEVCAITMLNSDYSGNLKVSELGMLLLAMAQIRVVMFLFFTSFNTKSVRLDLT